MSDSKHLSHGMADGALFRQVLDSAPDAMLVADDAGLIRYANRQAEELFGYANTELEGRSIDMLVPVELRPEHHVHRRAFHTQPSTRPMGVAGSELKAQRRDGSVLPVEISLSPVYTSSGMLVAAAVRDVTVRKRNELAIRQLAAIVESSEDAIIGETLGDVITSWNQTATRIFGYTAEEMLGKTSDILLPEDRKREKRDMLQRIARGERVAHFETQRRTKDGRVIDVSMALSPIHDLEGHVIGASKVARDITERKRIERIAVQAHHRLAGAIESIQGAVAIYDAEDRLAICNSTYRLWFGAATGDIIGRTHLEIVSGATGSGVVHLTNESREQFIERNVAYFKNPVGTFEFESAEGRHLRLVTRRTAEGGSISVIFDITSDVEREEELRRARVAAEAASQAKSEFLSSMSHELRTPLNAILGFTQLLERDKKTPLTGKQQERVSHVLKAGEHLLRLIDEVLDLARIEAGRVTISMEPVTIEDVMIDVESTLRPMAERAGISLRVTGPLAELPSVTADRTRLAQILMNFSSNAIKYGRRGGHVVLAAELHSDRVRMSVRDDGIGIPEEHQDKVFQPFQRAGQETGPIEGTGIGLTISKRLAELMRGGVGFRSKVGEGTEFWVELPIDTSKLTAPPVKRPESHASLNSGDRHLVLYVEDNPSNIDLMEDILDGYDMLTLITAPNAEIGIELARARHPDIIIMDIHLPGMSGTEAAKRLRELPETRNIPVIALTAAAMLRDARVIAEAGIGRVLTKPVKVDELMNVLDELLQAAKKD